jgi:GNAT superfamily N-acetyltransferase
VPRHLAQLNIATLRHPIDDPRTADFVDALPLVNGAGEATPGYIWRLQSEAGDATDIRVFDDPMVIVNLTVWASLDALKGFAYRGLHRDFFKRRAEWFVPGSSRTALWWLPASTLPTTDDAKRRLDFIDAFGLSPYAFEMGQQQRALTIEVVGNDDERARQMLAQLDDGDVSEADSYVVAELDDEPAACGGYRRIDEHTAEIRRMYVAQPARGLRIGAAIVAELAAVAEGNGIERVVLETGQRQSPSIELYERFGFRRCACWSEHAERTGSVCLEKSLGAAPSRLA